MPLELREVVGNLFSASREYSLAHCVGADFRMGRGIAVGFMTRFGRRDHLKSQNVHPGGVAILEDRQRFVYYLVTKQFSYQPATYDLMLSSLRAMRSHMWCVVLTIVHCSSNYLGGSMFMFAKQGFINNGIDKLAIPRLGCGLDKLTWARVKSQIMEVFSQDSIEIVVYIFIRH